MAAAMENLSLALTRYFGGATGAERSAIESNLEAFRRSAAAPQHSVGFLRAVAGQLSGGQRGTPTQAYLVWFGASAIDSHVCNARQWRALDGPSRKAARDLLAQFLVATAGALPLFTTSKVAAALPASRELVSQSASAAIALS